MEEKVQRYEILYRGIKRSQPDTIDRHGRPTSALFKQEDGVSVDRDGDRKEAVIIDKFKARFGNRLKGLTKVPASICIDNDMAVIPKPTDNIYHAEIFENQNKEPLSQLKALILADKAEIVFFDQEILWS